MALMLSRTGQLQSGTNLNISLTQH